ncbi:MAG: glycosyltransferase involved in cell wall biosynthesis [Cryomorphaceae bacterium]|jgi:glycosyltransferase involved in cell wall biosynthesis
MNLLFITTQLPYPPKSGGVIKSFRLIEHWSKSHDVTVACLLKGDDNKHLEEFTNKVNLKKLITEEFNVKRSGLNLIISYLKGMTLNIFRNFSTSFLARIRTVLGETDLIFVDHYEMYEYIKKLSPKQPVILHEHNAEFVMWQRLAEIESSFIKRTILKMEASRIKKAELNFVEHAQLTLAAPNDIDELVSVGADRKKFDKTYHLGEDEMIQWPLVAYSKTELRILYIGTLTWEANVDGLVWFLESVWPGVRSKHPGVQLDVVGKNPDQRIVDLANEDSQITLLGFIDDLRTVYDRSRVFICPLRFGSGIKVKVLNAMYRGIPTVTTEIGVEGLEMESGKEIFYNSADSKEFSHQISLLMEDKDLWEAMQRSAREKATDYTWSSLLDSHDQSMKSLLRKNI